MKHDSLKNFERQALLLLVGFLLYQSAAEFYNIAWGTGNWFGEFSRTWAFLYIAFILFCIVLFILSSLFFYKKELFSPIVEYIIDVRQKSRILRWFLWLFFISIPVYFFQYTSWGVVFQKIYIRILLWAIIVFLLTIISSKNKQIAGWNEFLISLIFTASFFSIFASLKYVNNYPFSLGWSEGNRLWDYSVMFGSDLYLYPKDKTIPVFLDFGRRLVGGLPFLLPNVSITISRLWVGLTLIIPYLLLGIATFRIYVKNKGLWLLLILWTFLFLKQGPIHPPLVLSAALVALAWQSNLWIAIPLMIMSGYFAEASRFTWVFAPSIWIFMLEFTSASFSDLKSGSPIWKRALTLGIVAILGGFFLQSLINSIRPLVISTSALPTESTIQPPLVEEDNPVTAVSKDLNYIEYITVLIKDQPFLWYRLLPNSTYGQGIILALLLAVAPITIVLLYLSTRKIWEINKLQRLSLVLPLLAFLVVGLVASTKIGGGGDLHNMDMFLISLLFISAIAWERGGKEWLQNASSIPFSMKIVISLLFIIPSISPLLEMRSYSFGEEIASLQTLTDTPDNNRLEMLPTKQETDAALQVIQQEVDQAKLQGEVLFMDQRQLLTFGYITDVPLVPAYEKKLVMNQALSGNADYFNKLYADLENKRFSLIITEPLRTPTQDSSFEFGEENNAWVKWVSIPVLCYYEPIITIKTVGVQLLVPNENTQDCSTVLP